MRLQDVMKSDDDGPVRPWNGALDHQPPCVAKMQPTWYNNGHRKGRLSNWKEKREVEDHNSNGKR